MKLEWAFFKLSAIADLQMPFNIGLQFVNDTFWYLLQIILFESIYLHIDSLAGWGVAEMRVFLGVLFVVDALYMIFFVHNFDVFSEKVVRRDLDLFLARPVSTLQLMTAQKIQFSYFLNLTFALVWLFWSLTFLPGGFPWIRSLFLLIVVPAALAIIYSMRLMFCSIALLITRAEQFNALFYAISKMGHRPDRLYGPGIRYLILLIMPVGMMASFPTRVLVEPADRGALPGLLIVSAFFFWVSTRFWKWSLRRYMIQG